MNELHSTGESFVAGISKASAEKLAAADGTAITPGELRNLARGLRQDRLPSARTLLDIGVVGVQFGV